MKAALEFRSNDAIDYYTQSSRISPNPSPYINRANLLGKRVRHFEALQDLLQAQQLDRSQGNQFGPVLAFEIARTSALTAHYTSGLRNKLIADFEDKGAEYVAGRVVCQAFNIPHIRWEHGLSTDPMLEFHFFNELDTHIKFDDHTIYPEAEYLAEQYPGDFIELKLQQCPDADAYARHEAILHGFLCSYPVEVMVQLRRTMLYRMHAHMLARDFGDMYNALGSDCNGIIKEAEEFIEAKSETEAQEPWRVKGGFSIGGIQTTKHPESPSELFELTKKIAPELAKRLPMEEDFYWFVIEQFDRLHGKSEYLDEVLSHLGLHPIEYVGMRSEQSYVGKSNPGVTFFEQEIVEPLSKVFDSDGVDYAGIVIFTGFCQLYGPGVIALRRKYAAHYHKNCVSQGSYNSADQWVAVLNSL